MNENERGYKGTNENTIPFSKIEVDDIIDIEKSNKFFNSRLEKFEKIKSKYDALKHENHDKINILYANKQEFSALKGYFSPADIVDALKLEGVLVARVLYNNKKIEEESDGHFEVKNDENGILWDLKRPFEDSGKVSFYTFNDYEGKMTFFHSAAHLLGYCIEKTYGGLVTIGPSLKNGFYYDFYCGKEAKISPDDFEKLVKLADELKKKSNSEFVRLEITKDEALDLFSENPFKLAIINSKVKEKTTVYKCGDFIDLCMGPHITNLKLIKAFSVEKTSATYWLGDAKLNSLYRLYGLAYPNKKLMTEYKKTLALAKLNDHKLLGSNLDYFFFESEYSSGSAFWTSHGTKIYVKICDMLRKEYQKRGYQEVITPLLFNKDLFTISGHWQNYKNNMFVLDIEKKEWALKPMNCPSHCCIFRHLSPSYKQLPLRLADFGVLHRNEFSGSLSGLTRVRKFQQDDAHIFCELSQVKEEVTKALEFLFFVYKLFGFDYKLLLSTKPEKALGSIDLWEVAEKTLIEVLNSCDCKWELNSGDGAFYGPKIDVMVLDALNRYHQLGTVQLDFQLPLRFDLQYKGPESTEEENIEQRIEKNFDYDKLVDFGLETQLKNGYLRPVMIHRAILGSCERMIAILLEHYKGNLPFWLNPRQILICPINSLLHDYAKYIFDTLTAHSFDVEIDLTNTTLNKKIRTGIMKKFTYLIIIGNTEKEQTKVTLRNCLDTEEQVTLTIKELLDRLDDMRDITGYRKNLDKPYVESSNQI